MGALSHGFIGHTHALSMPDGGHPAKFSAPVFREWCCFLTIEEIKNTQIDSTTKSSSQSSECAVGCCHPRGGGQ